MNFGLENYSRFTWKWKHFLHDFNSWKNMIRSFRKFFTQVLRGLFWWCYLRNPAIKWLMCWGFRGGLLVNVCPIALEIRWCLVYFRRVICVTDSALGWYWFFNISTKAACSRCNEFVLSISVWWHYLRRDNKGECAVDYWPVTCEQCFPRGFTMAGMRMVCKEWRF